MASLHCFAHAAGTASTSQRAAPRTDPAQLYAAAAEGNTLLLSRLLDGGCDPNMPDTASGSLPLVAAARGNHRGAVELLCSAGAKVDAQLGSGDTALHHAAARGCMEAIRALLAAGAPLHAKNARGRTPLHQAAYYGCIPGIRALVAAGASMVAR